MIRVCEADARQKPHGKGTAAGWTGRNPLTGERQSGVRRESAGDSWKWDWDWLEERVDSLSAGS